MSDVVADPTNAFTDLAVADAATRAAPVLTPNRTPTITSARPSPAPAPNPTPTTSQLVIAGVSKTYSAKDGKVLDAIDLDVARGELVSLLGPSGCGKSTLLRMVAGFIKVDEGRISIAGNDVTRVPTHRRNVGIVHQSHALWPHLTVAENVAFGLEMRKIKRPERERRVAEVLDIVGLADLARRLPPELSGGQQQRVALARALVIEPQVLLLDEPLSSLDANLRVHLREEIRRIQRELAVTTIFVTHDREEAMAVSDRIVLLQGGHIVQEGTATDLYRDPVSSFVMGFTGSMVAFESTVADVDGTAVLTTELGTVPVDPAVVPIGDGAIVAIRPDDLTLTTGDAPTDGALTLDGVLADIAFLGTSLEARIDLVGGRRIEARLPPRQLVELPELGQAIRLRVEPEHVHVFPAA
jgi:ABC-type Fe3+/spermidine/putrescine transport system ATPase subunit